MSDQPSDSTADKVAVTTDPIEDFCRSALARHSEHWPVNEDVLAEEFLAFFRLNSFLTFELVAQFCGSKLRIAVSLASLPEELKGFNRSYGGMREILISDKQGIPDARLHTLLHELRELIEYGFQKLGNPVAQGGALENRAEAFASSVQISAALKLVPALLNNAAEIEKKWMRIGAYVLIVIGAIVYSFACGNVPYMEDAFAGEESSR